MEETITNREALLEEKKSEDSDLSLTEEEQDEEEQDEELVEIVETEEPVDISKTYIYSKQDKLFKPDEFQPKIFVYGIGSLGSHVVMGLAKVGFKDITVYDFDTVEPSNVPAQFYDITSFGKKTDELKRLVKQMTGIDINIEDVKIDETFQPNLSVNSIHMNCVDDMNTFRLIYNKLKGFPIIMFDGRVGGFNYQKYYVNMMEDNTKYEKTMEGEFSELQCGEKCLWIVNSRLSSLIVTDVIKLSKDKIPSKTVVGNVMSDICITDEEEDEDE